MLGWSGWQHAQKCEYTLAHNLYVQSLIHTLIFNYSAISSSSESDADSVVFLGEDPPQYVLAA